MPCRAYHWFLGGHMLRRSALLFTAAVLTAAIATPAAAGTPILDPVATASAYALTVNGQTEGLSITWRPSDETDPSISLYKNLVGPNALHAGWGVHVSDPDVAPQFPFIDYVLRTRVVGQNIIPERTLSFALVDSRGAFMTFGNLDDKTYCNLNPDYPNGHGSKSDFGLYLRNAQGEMVRAPGTGLGVAFNVPGVDAGDQAAPDGQERTTTVHFKRRVTTVAGLAPWAGQFPATYEAAAGLNLVVTQRLGDNPPVVYDFLVGGGACAA
ncbi:hypothetical protein LX88_003790 [Lentzea californiensis]|nr:hypothetical protein [Lentzea californiensis]